MTSGLVGSIRRAYQLGRPSFLLNWLRYSLQSKRVRCFPLIAGTLRGDGIEVGGPSVVFQPGRKIPVYPLVSSLTNYGFKAGPSFEYGDRVGRSYDWDAISLPVASESCDFVLSSHMLEHAANPIRALLEWRRIIKPGGCLLLVLPDGKWTFDHRRPVTSLEHLLSDFKNETPEDDLTHIQEAIERTDQEHWSFSDWPEWRSVFRNNPEHRQVHHHVFDMSLADAVVRRAGFDVLASEHLFPYHLVVFAIRS
jgi:SAM-dependent methyltransferase